MGSCCTTSKPQSKKQPKYNDDSYTNDINQKQKENQDNTQGQNQKIDSKKIMKKKENGIVIGGANAEPNQKMSEDERRRKAAEAAEQRQLANKNRGLSEKGIVEMQFKEKKMQEAEKYEQKNENYVLQWK
ncbi:hypothetical protein ABPG74_006149 [Tetrahymena malaccensis]